MKLLGVMIPTIHVEACLSKQQLDARLRELAILRIARLSAAEYEWVQHVPIAEIAGVTAAQIEALERGEIEAACFDPVERAVLRFTSEVVRDVRASDATFAELGRWLGHREVVELVLAIGYYMLIARLLETTGVDLEPAAGKRLIDAIE